VGDVHVTIVAIIIAFLDLAGGEAVLLLIVGGEVIDIYCCPARLDHHTVYSSMVCRIVFDNSAIALVSPARCLDQRGHTALRAAV
jgi:hypothetical protein